MSCYSITQDDKAFAFCKFCNAMISWVESAKTGKKYPANVYPSNSEFTRMSGIFVVYTHSAHKCDANRREAYKELLGAEHPDNQTKVASAPVEMKDVVEGRVVITGSIVSVKTIDGDYGVTIKMLIQCDGYRVYGTMPAKLIDDGAKVDDVVTFTGTVVKSHKDSSFGTYSRPTKASIVK